MTKDGLFLLLLLLFFFLNDPEAPWLKLTDKQKSTATLLTYQIMQSFIGQTIYMITNLKWEMPKYKPSLVRNNVILIILIVLHVFQPVDI